MKHDGLFQALILRRLPALRCHSETRRRRGLGIHNHGRRVSIPGFLATLGTRNDSRARCALAAFVVAILLPAAASAQTYPDGRSRWSSPTPPAAATTCSARLVAERMSKALGGTIIVENRGGAGGTIATRQVAKSAPDGYTMLIATSSLAINPALYPNVGYDPIKDFAPIGLLASGANVVLVHPSVPANSIQELIALAKKDPGKLNFASTGSGSSVHLAAELFAAMAGIKINHVPYRGSGPALNDLLGGHVTMMFATLPSAIGIVKGGKVRALAVSSAKRSAVFPELPTIAEAGLTGYVAESALRAGGAGGHAAADHRQAQRGAALRARRSDVARTARARRRGAVAVDAGGIRRRHRGGGNQMVGDRQNVRARRWIDEAARSPRLRLSSPAQAGDPVTANQRGVTVVHRTMIGVYWMPAFAGMTPDGDRRSRG